MTDHNSMTAPSGDVALIDRAARDFPRGPANLWAHNYGPRLIALARLASTPAPDATGDALTADFTRGLPSGTFDDATYEQIEAALDAAEAPSIDKGNWLKLHERVAALAVSRAPVQL